MKKLALILLIGIYSIAVVGAGAGSLICCDVTDAAVSESTQNIPRTITTSSDDCNNSHHGTTFKNHHIAAATIHFSSRNYYSIQPHTGFASTATSSIVRHALAPAGNVCGAVPNCAVPAYILHCVYRI